MHNSTTFSKHRNKQSKATSIFSMWKFYSIERRSKIDEERERESHENERKCGITKSGMETVVRFLHDGKYCCFIRSTEYFSGPYTNMKKNWTQQTA